MLYFMSAKQRVGGTLKAYKLALPEVFNAALLVVPICKQKILQAAFYHEIWLQKREVQQRKYCYQISAFCVERVMHSSQVAVLSHLSRQGVSARPVQC